MNIVKHYLNTKDQKHDYAEAHIYSKGKIPRIHKFTYQQCVVSFTA